MLKYRYSRIMHQLLYQKRPFKVIKPLFSTLDIIHSVFQSNKVCHCKGTSLITIFRCYENNRFNSLFNQNFTKIKHVMGKFT